MNKHQTKQVAMVNVYLANGMADTAARSLSALIRSAMTKKSQCALLALAQELNINNHPEFII